MWKLAIRIAFMLGFFEAFGFVQVKNTGENAAIVNACFALFYVFARSMRGLLIFFSFVVRKNILDMYREKLGCNIAGDSSTSATTSARSRKITIEMNIN